MAARDDAQDKSVDRASRRLLGADIHGILVESRGRLHLSSAREDGGVDGLERVGCVGRALIGFTWREGGRKKKEEPSSGTSSTT